MLLFLMLVSGFAEVISLGAVIPFLSVLTVPELLFKHTIVQEFAQIWGITSAAQLVLPLTIVFIIAALVAGAIRIFYFGLVFD